MVAWMNNEGYRNNILNAKMTMLGAAMLKSTTGKNYWTLVLASPAPPQKPSDSLPTATMPKCDVYKTDIDKFKQQTWAIGL